MVITTTLFFVDRFHSEIALVLLSDNKVIMKRGSWKELEKSLLSKAKDKKLVIEPDAMPEKEIIIETDTKQAATLAAVVTQQWATFHGVKPTDLDLVPRAKRHYRISA